MKISLSELHPGLKDHVTKQGWSKLTGIQQAAFGPIFGGEDAVLEAPTADGKTEAVFFPLLTREAPKGLGGVRILYLAPLRALLNDIELRAIRYSEACGISAFKWHGDVDNRKKWGNFTAPAPVLLTTPESLEAILIGKPGWADFFRDLSAIVIDEAHNFAAGDRGCHLVSLLERVEAALERKVQRVALTATVGNPERMLRWLAGRRHRDGRRVFVPSEFQKKRDFQLKFFDSSHDSDVTGAENLARVRLFHSLRDELPANRSLVFVRSRSAAESYAGAFAAQAQHENRIPPRIRTHHSAVSKYYREEAEGLIKLEKHSGIEAIISTSTLELGIDIGKLDKVFQIGCAPSSSSFLQRVGRTGRRPGRSQHFRGLIEDEDELELMTGVLSLGLKGKSEALLFPTRAFHILVHQILCLARQHYGIRPTRAWEILKNADCFSGISPEEFNGLIRHLLSLNILRDVDGDVVIGEEGEKIFLGGGGRRLFAVFETGPIFVVIEGGNEVGYLDCGFVEGVARDQPFNFILAGILWTTVKIDLEHRTIVAKRSKGGGAPVWGTFGSMDVPFETAQEVGRLLTNVEPLPFLDSSASEVFDNLRLLWRDSEWISGKILVKINDGGDGSIVTFAGDKINRTIAKFLSATGSIPGNKIAADYKRIAIKPHRATRAVSRVLKRCMDELAQSSEESISSMLLDSAPENPFSRLTAQLPQEQLKAMYIDRAMDVVGAIELVKKSSFVGMVSSYG